MGVLFKNLTSELFFLGGPLSDRSEMMLKESDGKLECSSIRYVMDAPCDGEVEKTLKDDKAGKEESNEDQGTTEGGADNSDGQEGGGDDQADANENSGAGGDSGDGNGEGKDDKEKDSEKAAGDMEEDADATAEDGEEEKKEVEEEPKEVIDATDASNAPKSEEKVTELKKKIDAPEEVKEVAQPVVLEASELSVSGEKSISLSPGKGKKKVVEEDVANGADQTAKRTKISE